MTNPSLTFDKTLGDTTYLVDARPVLLAVLAAVVALGLLITLLVHARRLPGALASPLLALLSLPFAGTAVLVYGVRHFPWFGRDEHGATTIFRDALLLDAGASALGVSVAIAAVLVVALRGANRARLLPFAIPAAVLGLGTMGAIAHADSIAVAGSMPFYQVDGHRDVHVGRDRDVPVHMMRPPRRKFWGGMEDGPQPVDDYTAERWSARKRVHVHAAKEPGPVTLTAEARRGAVTLSTRLTIRAVPETASPLLSLRVGDRSVYRVRAKSSDGALLFFVKLSGYESIQELSIEVVGTRERDGFRTFVLEIAREEQVRQVEVVAISGETRTFDAEHGTVGEPIVALMEGGDRADPIPCTFALLDAPNAMCQRGGRAADVPAAAPVASSSPSSRRSRNARVDSIARPPVAFEGAAPATFTRSTSSTGGGIVTAFVAIVTIGLVILPDGSSSASYTLVSTHRGPVGAPEAPPG